MIWKLAWRNIQGAGLRSVINIIIIALVMIGIIWSQGMYEGWMRTAERESREWLNGDGRITHKMYDRFDPFSWDKSFGQIPDNVQDLVDKGAAVPILITPGSIYPEGRMISLIIKGIPAGQQFLKLPTAVLTEDGDDIPALIGSNMAKSSHVKEGDIVTLRWRDMHGAFNAADIRIAKIMKTPSLEADNGQVWIDLERLRKMKDAPNTATFIVLKDAGDVPQTSDDWTFESIDFLLRDMHTMMKTEKTYGYLMFALLILLAMIAIFDTQVLAVFKRRKEIGTFAALGMTQKQIIRMFTAEGMLYAVFASVAAGILGMPLFIYFGTVGYRMPESTQDFGIEGLSEAVIFYYTPAMIISTVIIVVVITAFVSWIPTLRIARLKPTDALRGRMG
jgi:putative ABC transport system permease protein